MPTSLAILLTISFVTTIMWWEARRTQEAGQALWLPVLWLTITGSRFVSQWMTLGQPVSANYTDGSPLDAIYFLSLILAGITVLARRRISLAEVIRHNPWLVALCLFGLLSVLWSDFPFIAFKRWVKTLGHPVMALIILTEPDPRRALRTVLKRCAFVLVPTSLLFIKYLPQFGRGFDDYTGAAFNRGVGLTKNDLGYICMVFGLFFVWNLLSVRHVEQPANRRLEALLSIAFLSMLGWLLLRSNSATSLAGVSLGIATLLLLRSRLISKQHIGAWVIAGLLIAVAAEATFDVYEHVVRMLGRNPNLTDRTEVWADVIALQPNAIVGAGFESFWLGPRLQVLWAKWWWLPTQAHNGYIETYLNLGIVGILLLFGLIVSVFRKIGRQLLTPEADFAGLRLALLFAIIAFNYTEAGFKGVHFVWTLFYIIAMEYPRGLQAVERIGPAVRSFGSNVASSLVRHNGQAGRARGRTTSDRPALR